jgi:hypothetical protein
MRLYIQNHPIHEAICAENEIKHERKTTTITYPNTSHTHPYPSTKIEQDACSTELVHGLEEEETPLLVASPPISRAARESSKFGHSASTSQSL